MKYEGLSPGPSEVNKLCYLTALEPTLEIKLKVMMQKHDLHPVFESWCSLFINRYSCSWQDCGSEDALQDLVLY